MNLTDCIILLQRIWRNKTNQQKINMRTFIINRIRRECESCGIFTLNKNELCYECNYYYKYS